MMSMREAASRIGLQGSFSVVHGFLSFRGGVPDHNISLRHHVAGMLGQHFTINIIRMSAEDFIAADIETIDIAIQDLRDIYQQARVGVNVDHFAVEGEDADGFRVITKMGRFKKLLRTFRGPGRHNIDAFLVPILEIPVGGGKKRVAGAAESDSPTKCREKNRPGKRGLGIGMNLVFFGFQQRVSATRRARTAFGRSLAHEIGHLLIGRSHTDDENNLMFSDLGGDDLTDEQGATIRDRCAVVDQ